MSISAKRQSLSIKNITSQGIYLRSARYRLKSVKETIDPQKYHSVIDVTEDIDNPSIKNGHSSIPHNSDLIKRGYSLNQNIRVRRSTPHLQSDQMFRSNKDWSPATKRADFATPTYMQSVNQIMNLKQTVKDIDNVDWQGKSRIDLPVLEDLQMLESQFTVLDPIRIQIDYVQSYINQTHSNLQEVKNHLQVTGQTMKTIQSKIISSLNNIQINTLNKLSTLKTLLHRDHVKHSENQMSMKVAIASLDTDFKAYKQQFDKTLSHIQDLQQVLFQTLPFELIENPDFEAPAFQQKLF